MNLQGILPTVSSYFGGQNPIDDESLPTELNVNDWPIGEISFFDLDYDLETDELTLLGGVCRLGTRC